MTGAGPRINVMRENVIFKRDVHKEDIVSDRLVELSYSILVLSGTPRQNELHLYPKFHSIVDRCTVVSALSSVVETRGWLIVTYIRTQEF